MIATKRWSRQRIYNSVFLFCSLFLFFIATAPSQNVVAQEDEPIVDLTDEQWAWLAEHDVIRIGVDPEYAPYSFIDNNGAYVGVAMDFMALLGEQLGVEFEVVPGLSWPEIINGAQDRSLDVIVTAVQTEERDQFLDFTEIYLPTPLVIMTRADDDRIQTPADLVNKTVALVDGYSSSQRVQNEHTTIDPYLVATPLEGLFAVSAGNADAYVGVLGINLYLASNYGVQNLQIATQYDLQGNGQRLAVRNDWSELAPILEKTLNAIPEEQKSQIFQKWIPVQFEEEETVPENLMLTDEEMAWLAEHPVIQIAADPNYAPIEFRNASGEFQGVSADYLEEIGTMLGISFAYTTADTWGEVIVQMENRELDLLSAAVQTSDREQFAEFTTPYLTLPTVIFTHDDVSFISDLSQLEGQKVAVVRGFAIIDYLAQAYPDIELVETDDVADALQKVSQKEASAYIGDILTTGYYIRQGNYQNIKVSGESPYQIELAMGVRNDWPIFATILQKSLDVLSTEERDLITRKWTTIEVGQAFDYRQLLMVGLVALGIFVIVAGWNLSLQREIGKRKQTEGALREAINTAESAQLEAERANQAKSTFLANMSHELRTPLNAIIGFARMMKRDSSLSVKVRKNLNIINVSGEHLLSLINDVLDMSKIEAGRIVLNSSAFNLYDLLRDVENMLRNRAQSKGLSLVFELDSDLPAFVETDEKKLRQVLINLLNNGIKFTETGQVTLAVSVDLLAVQMENGRQPAQLNFDIIDTGVGIAVDEIEQVFAPFVQTTSGQQSGEGTGLGLPISRQFVQLMGGEISLKSELGKGSTFTFDVFVHLPESETAATIEDEVEVVGLVSGQAEYRILIADDVQENRALLQTLLSDVGFVVREAANGQAAIDLWQSWRPHLIWMDIRMPIMDGLTATTYIRDHEEAEQRTAIIALSSSILSAEREAILATGADEFVAKPFRESEIFTVMGEYLGVEYLYGGEGGGQPVFVAERLDLSMLAPKLLDMLETAVKKIDMDGINLAIAHIRQEFPETADKLAYFANDYQYTVILNEIVATRQSR